MDDTRAMRRWPFIVAAAFLLTMNLIHQSDAKVNWHDPTSAIFLCSYVICCAIAVAIRREYEPKEQG